MYHFMYFGIMASNIQNYIEIQFLDVYTGPQGMDGIEISLLLMYCIYNNLAVLWNSMKNVIIVINCNRNVSSLTNYMQRRAVLV